MLSILPHTSGAKRMGERTKLTKTIPGPQPLDVGLGPLLRMSSSDGRKADGSLSRLRFITWDRGFLFGGGASVLAMTFVFCAWIWSPWDIHAGADERDDDIGLNEMIDLMSVQNFRCW